MDFVDYRNCTVDLAVDLVNTLPDSDGVDRLQDDAALLAFLKAHDFSGVSAVSAGDVRDVRALRPRLREVFHAGHPRAAADVLNALIAQAGALPRLVDHDGEPLHLHYEAPGASLADRIAVETAMGLATVLAGEGLTRLKTCDKDGCQDVFVDTSKNRSRRFCDPSTCGNAYHVAAHRARKRKSSA